MVSAKRSSGKSSRRVRPSRHSGHWPLCFAKGARSLFSKRLGGPIFQFGTPAAVATRSAGCPMFASRTTHPVSMAMVTRQRPRSSAVVYAPLLPPSTLQGDRRHAVNNLHRFSGHKAGDRARASGRRRADLRDESRHASAPVAETRRGGIHPCPGRGCHRCCSCCSPLCRGCWRRRRRWRGEQPRRDQRQPNGCEQRHHEPTAPRGGGEPVCSRREGDGRRRRPGCVAPALCLAGHAPTSVHTGVNTSVRTHVHRSAGACCSREEARHLSAGGGGGREVGRGRRLGGRERSGEAGAAGRHSSQARSRRRRRRSHSRSSRAIRAGTSTEAGAEQQPAEGAGCVGDTNRKSR